MLEPETDTAPEPIVKTEVLSALAVKVKVPVFTVKAVVKVALVTLPAEVALVAVDALPVMLAAIAFVQVISIAQSLVNLWSVSPIVCPEVWSVRTAPEREVK